MLKTIDALKICVLIYTTWLLYDKILRYGRLYMVDIYVKLPYILGVYTLLCIIQFIRKGLIK
jgi:hypothetical protein